MTELYGRKGGAWRDNAEETTAVGKWREAGNKKIWPTTRQAAPGVPVLRIGERRPGGDEQGRMLVQKKKKGPRARKSAHDHDLSTNFRKKKIAEGAETKQGFRPFSRSKEKRKGKRGRRASAARRLSRKKTGRGGKGRKISSFHSRRTKKKLSALRLGMKGAYGRPRSAMRQRKRKRSDIIDANTLRKGGRRRAGLKPGGKKKTSNQSWEARRRKAMQTRRLVRREKILVPKKKGEREYKKSDR